MTMESTNKTPCYTFYSYKGGSGRSTTAINTVNHLIDRLKASPKKPILLIDADLESAGLTFFFGQEKKFNSFFAEALHSTMFLDGRRDPADCFNKSRLRQTMPPKTKAAFDEFFSDEVPSVKDLFDGVALQNKDWSMLSVIIQKYKEYKETRKDNDIYKQYDVAVLLSALRKIHNDTSLSADQMLQNKLSLIDDFLPASIFVDVSHFFGRPAGTVRFLGVDINYQGDRMVNDGDDAGYGNTVSNKSVIQIQKLLRLCSNPKYGHNYAAVVFDSGAGTQSSAHLFHQCSDVLVYCMRPSMQFARGTYTNIERYQDTLRAAKKDNCKTEEQKSIILLPTAVPINDEFAPLRQNCFKKIREIVEDFPDLVDGTFCTPDNALCEVSLFKWREQILGVNGYSCDENTFEHTHEVCQIVRHYADPENFEEGSDAERAYKTYQKLAAQIVQNSLKN